MHRLLCGIVFSLPLLAAGCCGPCSRYGCGDRYWGAYAEDPPRCEPCDACGNWTGCCDSPYPWIRSQGRRAQWFAGAPAYGCTAEMEVGCGVGETPTANYSTAPTSAARRSMRPVTVSAEREIVPADPARYREGCDCNR